MDMKISALAMLLGTWLAKSLRSSALLLPVLLCLGATSAFAVTWDYEPGTGTITGFTGSGSKTVTQVNTAAGETLRGVSVNDNMGGTAVSGSAPYAGSDSLFSSANYNGETSVTFSLVSGKQFDLTSIAFTEFMAISETITLTSSKGTASYFVNAGGSGNFNVAGDANAAKMQGITSFTVTANPTNFGIGFDDIVLSNITSPASAPTATTGAASSIGATGATLNGTVNDNGASTTVTFDYGTTTGYGTNVAASTGGTVTAGSGNTAVAKTLTGLSCNTTYHFRVKGVNSAGTTNGSDASFTTSKCPQTITFNNPGAQNFGTTPTLSATATSGLTVSFTSSTTGVCTITSGGALTFVSTGTCTINADQAGNSTYAAASTVSRSFSVNAVVPGAPTIGTATAGDTQASISFSAPSSNGGASIIGYTVTSSPGGITGTGASSPITVTGLTNGTAYTFTVTATNSAGTGSASSASNSVTPKGAQTITFNNPGAQNFGTTPTLSATATSGLTVSFTSSTTGVCTITSGGTLTFVTTGTCTIDADQAGNSSYLAATTVSRSFSVNAVVPGAPTIGTATAGDTQVSVAFSAPASNGGASITGYTVTSSPGGITGTGASSPITVTGLTNGTAYTFTVTATNSAGTGSASSASNSATPQASQTITFNNPGAQNFGTTPTLSATATSGLTVSFTSSTTGVCTITSGGALTFVTTGTCTINADQAGNGAYLAASTVSRSFSVNAIVPGAPTIGTATRGNAQASVTFSAPASNGGSAITGYTVTSSPGGFTGTGASSPITVTGLTNGTAYTFTVTATNSAGTGSASAASNSITPATVPGAPTIGTPVAGNAQVSVSFSAPASNGGSAITGYTVTSSPGGFTATGASSPIVVTGLTNGTAYSFTVTATNAIGTGSASGSTSSVTPATVPGAPTIGTATAGNAQASVSFSAPASNGGIVITGYTVTSSPGGLTGTGASSPITVTGLSNGTAYTFTVTATNNVGTGSASAASNSVTPATLPGAPTIGTATAGDAQASISFSAPASNGGAAITGYTVTSSPGGLTGTGASSPVTVTGLTNGTAYTFTVTATNNVGTGSASSASNSITPKGTQTITFTNPGAQNFGTTPTLSATSTSGLTVAFTSSTTGVCTITSGGALTFVTPGTCTIDADQAGNSAYLAAATVSRSFSVNAVVPGAPTIGTATRGNAQASVTFSAPSSNGGSAITGYTVTSSPGGITGTGASSPITVTGLTNGTAYTFTVTATNSVGTGSASAASNSITPATLPGAPTIGAVTAGNTQVTVNFSAPASNGSAITAYTVTSSPGGITATGASSPVIVTGLTNGTSYTFTVTATNGVGTGSASAASASVTPATVPGAPIIGTPVAGNGQVTINFSAPASNGGSAITGYTVTSSPGGITATGTSSPIVVTGLTNGTAYSFTVTATNVMGTSSPSGSTSNVTPATVPGAPTIGSATAGNAQATVSFTAPASNGGIVITGYTVTSSPGGITHSGASSPITVTGLTNGTAYTFTVTATNSVGSGSASAASNSVTPAALPGAPTIGSATAGDAQATVNFTAPASNGGGVITAYTVTSSPGGLTGTGASSPITVTGLANGTAYTFTVTATNSTGTGSASAASNSVTPKGTQTITFNNPGSQNFGTTPTLTATSDSGLTPTFSSSTTDVCTIASGGALTFVKAGSCTINADQTGNGSFLPAPQVSRTFTVNAVVPGAPTGLAATAGKAQATVSFTAPVFTGGAAITSYTVTSSPGGITATGPSSPLTVTGLTDGTAYTFTTVATNSAGDSAASAPSNSVTPVSGPAVTAPADIDVDAVGLFTPVDIGTATAEGGIKPTVTQVNGKDVTAKPTHFRPGANTVTWSATDGAGHTGTAVQRVNVTPLVDFSKSQISAEGSTATIKVILNGAAVSYPVTVPYTVGGTASIDGSDHDLVDGSVTINSPDLEAAVSVHFVNDGPGEGTETLVLTMGTPTHAVPGQVKTHTVEIREGNVAPAVVLSAAQGSGATRLIGQGNGMVTVTAAVTDPNVGDTHSYNWSGTDNALVDLDAVPGTFTFDPAGLTPGLYKLKVAVSDGTAGGTAELLLKVEAALPVLTAVDSDGDGINDDVEGAGDSDGDGIPDYLDNAAVARNVVQEKSATATQYLMETEPGLFLTLGQVAFRASGDKVGVSDAEVQSYANNGAGAPLDEGRIFNGGLFDFDIAELPVAGQQVKVVLAQFAAIPANAVYRKLLPTGWQDFVVDANNHIASAAGAAGYCPPPGDSAYTPGLTEGHWCVQLTIQDGGPNDADGAADQHIRDPGGVGQQTDQPITIVITGSGGGSGAFSHWLLMVLGLALLLRSKGRRWLMLPVALIAAPVQADTSLAAFMPDYVGVSYLAVKSDERSDDFKADLNAVGLNADVTQTDLSRSGWSPYLGYRLNETVAVELGYVDLGTATTTINGATADVNSYLATASAVHPVTASGWTLDLVMRKSVHEGVDALFKFGALRWKADYTLASATASRNFSDTGFNGNLGIGLEMALTPHLPVRLGWNTYRFAGANVNAWELGIGYRF